MKGRERREKREGEGREKREGRRAKMKSGVAWRDTRSKRRGKRRLELENVNKMTGGEKKGE